RWHVNFCDLSGEQGMLGQVEGRTADDAAYWLLSAPPAWRDRIEVVAIDMCAVFASAVRRAPPPAAISLHPFPLAPLSVATSAAAPSGRNTAAGGRRTTLSAG